MKKYSILFPLMVIGGVFGFASEEVDLYEYLYNAAPTYSAQLDVLYGMVETKPSDAGDFYSRALRRLVAGYKNIRDVTEKSAADEQAMVLSTLLGSEKYSKAVADLWLVADDFSLPLVKAEALMALGKIRSDTYLPQVIRVLESLNTSPTADRLYGERIAFGAIIALEKYQDKAGYLPVYFASIGWYSDRVKQQALKSLPLIADDPTPFMEEVVKGPGYNYLTKYAALQTIENNKDLDSTSKAAIAVAALAEGWKGFTSDVELKTALANMRKLSITMINRYKSSDESIYPLLEQCYTSGFDAQEKLYALAALAAQGTDESARRLSKFLMDLNVKRQTGNIRQEEEQMVRAIIPALGQTGRPAGRPALSSVVGSTYWTPAVKRLAEDALKKIQ